MTFREALDLAEKQNERMEWQDLLILWAGLLTFLAFLFIILME